MSILGEAHVALDGSCLQCNKCRRMFAVDCSNASVSVEFLTGDAPTSKAEAIRKKIAAAKRSLDQRGPSESFVAGPSSMFDEVRAAPWLAAPAGGEDGDACYQEAPLTLSTMPLTLAPNVHLSTLIGERAKAQPLLRVDTAMLEPIQEVSHSRVLTEDDSGASPASVSMRDALQRRSAFVAAEDSTPAVRPRGGLQASATAADASQYGPYLQRALLLHAAWDLLEQISEEALINVPLCSGCWKEVLGDLQHRVDREQSLVSASQAYLHPTSENVAMCALIARDPGEQDNGSTPTASSPSEHPPSQTLAYSRLLDAVGSESVRELSELDDKLHELRNVQSELDEEEMLINEEEAIVESLRNSVELALFCNNDDRDAIVGTRQQAIQALQFAESQSTLRELFVIELPSGCPSIGVINGVRVGKETPPVQPQQAAATSSQLLSHSFVVLGKSVAPPAPGGSPQAPSSPRAHEQRQGQHRREFPVRDIARRTGGEPYHIFTNYGSYAVSVPEINGGCGFLIAALDAVVQRSGKGRLDSCVLRPNGWESMIDVPIPNKKPVKYDDLKFYIVDKLFSWKTFGQAWVAYCLGLREMIEFLQGKLSTRSGLDLHDASSFPPFPIDKEGRVGGFSPKHGSVSDEMWGRAVRCAMANLDWCLAAQTVVEEHVAALLLLQNSCNATGSDAPVTTSTA
ncbi:Hypothetical protein, putative [Bodo saltans]|uniref:Uncharacterized protein n=1 Tax=Bodo saltans TaxID=75058 RepID=A0A0S4IR92_BODSA|nr:Hypothetical protein, putative [Bodo saltans]|eukprot:CUF33234.1 Hypothetical protein, putative [Bodo saltans]